MSLQLGPPPSLGYLQSIADRLTLAKKVVFITGAGISTSAGIPVGICGSWDILKLADKPRTFGLKEDCMPTVKCFLRGPFGSEKQELNSSKSL